MSAIAMRNGLPLLSISCSLFFLLSGSIHAEDAASVLARGKAARGGAAWDNTRTWHGDGTFSAGRLNGEYHVTVDLIGGRSVDAYKPGPVDGAVSINVWRYAERIPKSWASQ